MNMPSKQVASPPGKLGILSWGRWSAVLALAAGIVLAPTAEATTTVTTMAGGAVYSRYVYAGSADGISTNAQFNYPMAGAIDLEGNLYIADHNNKKIRKMSSPSSRVDGFTSTLLTLSSAPLGVAVDNFDVLYIISENSKLTRYDLTARKFLSLTNQFPAMPTAISVTQDGTDYVFVTLTNGQVYAVSPAGAPILLSSQFKKPSGVAWMPSGWVAVSDAGNNAVWLLNPQTGYVEWLTGLTNGTVGRADGTTNVARFNQPGGIAATGDGRLVVADTLNHRVCVVGADGYVTTLYGKIPSSWTGVDGSNYFGWVDGDLTKAESRLPVGVTVSRDGVVYTTEVFYHVIRAVTGSGLTASLPAPSTPTFTPNCGYFTDATTITVSNTVGFVYYTTNATEPTADDTYVPINQYGVGTFVWNDRTRDLSSLRMKAFYGTNHSLTVAGGTCLPTAPVISPSQGYFTNARTITVSNGVGVVFYTTNNTEPTLDSAVLALDNNHIGIINWNNKDHDLSWLWVKSFNSFDYAAITVRGMSPTVSMPGFSPTCGLFLTPKSILVTNDAGAVYYTTNGDEPTMQSARVSMTNGAGYIFWNDPGHDLSALKVKAFSSPDAYSPTIGGTICAPSTPAMYPACGYFPNGTNITIINSVGVVVYTDDNTEPTLSSLVVQTNNFGVGTIWFSNKLHDLRWLRIKSYSAINVSSTNVQGQACAITTPAFAPDCGLFLAPQWITVSNDAGSVFYTTDGSEPTMASAFLGVTNGIGYLLWTNAAHDLSWLRVKTFSSPDNYSATIRGSVCAPTTPVISPSCGYFPDGTNILVVSAVGSVVYTTDGTEPTLNSPVLPMTNGIGYIYWQDSVHDLSWLRVKSYSTASLYSPTVRGDSCQPTTPVLFYSCADLSYITITVSNDVGTVYYTTDKSEPTTNSTVLPTTNGFGYIIWTNATHDLTWLKVKSVLRSISSPTVTGTACPPSDPSFWPTSGYFPDGMNISVYNKTGVVHYTTDGAEPTINSPIVTRDVTGYGSFFWADGLHDLSYLRLKAINGDLTSSTISGAASQLNEIGFAHDYLAGAGSTAVIPIVMNLQAGATVRTIQFRVEVSPISPNTNAISLEMQARLVTTNDFIQVIRPVTTGGSYKLNLSSATSLGGTTNGFTVSVNGTNAGFFVQNHAVVAQVCVPIPVAPEGTSWKLDLTHLSATSDGKSADVSIAAMASRVLVVSNLSYIVGDISPAGWYGAGSFGDDLVRNSDINMVYYASSGVYAPFDDLVNSASPEPNRQYSDAFNAMDAYPVDIENRAGGDGVINFYDSQTILARSFGLDTNTWIRSWTSSGVRTAHKLATSNLIPGGRRLAVSALTVDSASTAAAGPGKVWDRQAKIIAGTVENAAPGSLCSVPVYVNVMPGCTLSGLQFRAIMESTGSAPAIGQIDFTPSLGGDSLTVLQGESLNDIVCVFPMIPSPAFSPVLSASNYLGSIQFQLPANAQTGQTYTLRIRYPDGAQDLATPYLLESVPGAVWVGTSQQKAAEIISDQWKTNFFGSVTNVLADPNADPDGDGLSNLQEYLAGTDPTNAASRLQFLPFNTLPTGTNAVQVNWLSAPGKVYWLESATNLAQPTWTVVTHMTGDGYVQSVNVSRANARTQFYRLRVQAP